MKKPSGCQFILFEEAKHPSPLGRKQTNALQKEGYTVWNMEDVDDICLAIEKVSKELPAYLDELIDLTEAALGCSLNKLPDETHLPFSVQGSGVCLIAACYHALFFQNPDVPLVLNLNFNLCHFMARMHAINKMAELIKRRGLSVFFVLPAMFTPTKIHASRLWQYTDSLQPLAQGDEIMILSSGYLEDLKQSR